MHLCFDLSIHFPLTREDQVAHSVLHCNDSFQSTSLSRGKTEATPVHRTVKLLSIHFPLTREDLEVLYPNMIIFLSIHFPLTREDEIGIPTTNTQKLSIHFPLTREDPEGCNRRHLHISFNPLPSHEGRPLSSC